uniref:MFS domain-containing protein n=1 Tax=Rhabditophanes sp. KR3021 TaxID=114890 RepID=A0AC35U1V8_9BILA
MTRKLNKNSNAASYQNYLLDCQWDSDLEEDRDALDSDTDSEQTEDSYFFAPVSRDHLLANSFAPEDIMASIRPVDGPLPVKTMDCASGDKEGAFKKIKPYKWMFSYRMMTSALLCFCFASVHMMNANMGMAMVCMVNSTEYVDKNETSSPNDTYKGAPRVRWSTEEQGYVFGAFNAGLFCMLLIGIISLLVHHNQLQFNCNFSDKLNSKYMIIVAVFIASTANFIIPIMAHQSVYYVIFARFLVGLSDAFLQPAINSLLTRWFPRSERSYALGIVTGGRQMGTLLIVSSSGALCSQTAFFNGWPSIFYLSASFGIFFVIAYIIFGADKPSKQSCITEAELNYITSSTATEAIGAKRINMKTPWMKILKSFPVWNTIFSVICHEIPLMTMIMFLPSYLHDVHHYSPTTTGIVSSLPTLALWCSKIVSSYMTTYLENKTTWGKSAICKIMNGVGSFGLAIFMIIPTFLSESTSWLAVICLCASMFFAGMHTPGCQAALVSVAPAFSGAITGLTFFFVALTGIIHPSLTKYIVQTGSPTEWNIIFYASAIISALPCITFSLWGSSDVQHWAKAKPTPIPTVSASQTTMSTSTDSVPQADQMAEEDEKEGNSETLKPTPKRETTNGILNYATDDTKLAGYLKNQLNQ